MSRCHSLIVKLLEGDGYLWKAAEEPAQPDKQQWTGQIVTNLQDARLAPLRGRHFITYATTGKRASNILYQAAAKCGITVGLLKSWHSDGLIQIRWL